MVIGRKMTNPQSIGKTLDGKELQDRVLANLIPLGALSFYERYAVFMGKAQVVELALKGLLVKKYNHTEESVEKCTLGAAIAKLETAGLRGDFIHILKELNKHRISMAHGVLADYSMGTNLIGEKYQSFSEKELRNAL
jgi:hypothetical protein